MQSVDMKLSSHELWRLINALTHDTEWREQSEHVDQYYNEIEANSRILAKLRAAAAKHHIRG